MAMPQAISSWPHSITILLVWYHHVRASKAAKATLSSNHSKMQRRHCSSSQPGSHHSRLQTVCCQGRLRLLATLHHEIPTYDQSTSKVMAKGPQNGMELADTWPHQDVAKSRIPVPVDTSTSMEKRLKTHYIHDTGKPLAAFPIPDDLHQTSDMSRRWAEEPTQRQIVYICSH